MTFFTLSAAALALVLGTAPQDPQPATRAEAVREVRAAKARAIEAHERGRIEAILFKIEEDLVIERVFNPPRGFYARVGGLGEGAGFGGGPGFRYQTADWAFDASGALSLKGYGVAEATFALPGPGRRGPFAEVYARRRDFPQEDFFGLGPASREEQRTNFALRDTFARVTGGVRTRDLAAGASVGYLDPSIGRGTDRRMPSLEHLFEPSTVPGFSAQPAFTVIEPFIAFGDPVQGIGHRARHYSRIAFARHVDRDLDRFSFTRWDAQVQQVLPFVHATRSIALRGWMASSSADDGDEVPFYLQPTIGGAYSLRSVRSFRFRDRSAVLMQAEYRWRINEFAAGAFFYDTGAVGPRLRELGALEHSYGVGLRGGSRTGVAFRADLAFGDEGPRFLLRFDGVF